MTHNIIAPLAALVISLSAVSGSAVSEPERAEDKTEVVYVKTDDGINFEYTDFTDEVDGWKNYVYSVTETDSDEEYEDILKMFLSEKQYAEYKNIVDRLAEIEHKVSQKITKDMSPEEIDAVYAPYRTEMDRLNERIFAIFEEAGFSLEITDECYTDDNTFCAAFEISDGKD